MFFQKMIPSLLILAATVLASPLDPRASCTETCGSTCYYQSDIDAAVADGCNDYRSGTTEGGYPHTYNNYEGFNFGVSGPYQEFPILNTYKAYNGGSPGADRVIFNTQCQLAGLITHTGASGNNFVACKGQYV